MSDNIKVVVKVRPLISRELEDKLPHQWRVQNNTLYQVDISGRDNGQAFTFDKIYNEDTKTSDVYKDVAKPIVEAATAGFNGTIFAYGQTSSGKTYTMTGTDESPGIIPLAVLNLFENIKNIPDRDFLVRVSYIEIYNETVKDLLDVKKENIKIHEDYSGCIRVDASEKVTSSPEEVLEAMKVGEANRQTGSTNMNEKSSRSHSIFQITIESREHIEGTEEAGCVNVSQLNLVDLAGSERAGQTGAKGLRFKEGTHINKSLSALALVIKQLSEDPNKYANYRDSKLTRILQNSLGGNAKTSIICAITPAALEETISTLQFATRAKAIKNKPEVNAVATDATMIQGLTKQLSQLQSQLEKKKNLEVMLENKKTVEQDLQKQIAALQKLILNGFGQRSSIEQIGGARRKQPPRRITISSISTLHPIDEDPVPTVPRFCTPSLKYNPLTVQAPVDFLPVHSGRLASLPEEPPRLLTPPPTRDRKVNFNDDVIAIDSDEDNENNSTTSSVPTCSPYHKCFNESKTPPCILRKNCHVAEKNYKEILEFTEREKVFKPDVVDLMEKLEESTNITAKLRDEVELFTNKCKQKDLEMERLVFQINKFENDIANAKKEHDTFSRELNDKEVKYEILKKKFEVREAELLSLLEEQKLKKCEDISKLPPNPVEKPINFMDMSKDISLVNSDNESSVVVTNEEESDVIKTLVANLQDQLIDKSQTILQLEANVASQKQSIEFLEQTTRDLEQMIDSFKEKNAYLENENKLYKSNIDSLNETIKSQRDNLEIAQRDIASYTDTIQELQNQLTKKDYLLNINISDSILENMIANEENVIANNDNIKNLIQSFKIALENRNKEIEQLKSSIQEDNDSKSNALAEKMNDKIKQIETLNDVISKLRNDLNENITTIDVLIHEKSKLAGVEEELTRKIGELENREIELYELNKKYSLDIDNLNDINRDLIQSLSDKNAKEQEYIQLNTNLQNKLDLMSLKIIKTEEEINAKNDIISTLDILNNEKREYENQAKSALDKLKNVMSILGNDILEIPDFIDNCVTLFKALSNGLCLLENVANDTVSEKSVVAGENSKLKADIINLRNDFEIEKTKLQNEIVQLHEAVKNGLAEIELLRESNLLLNHEIDSISKKNHEQQLLIDELNSFKNDIHKSKEELHEAQNIIYALNKKETELKLKINDIDENFQKSDLKLKETQDHLKQKEEILAKSLNVIEDLNNQLQFKHEELTVIKEKTDLIPETKDRRIDNILNRLRDIAHKLNIDENISCEEYGDADSHERVMLLLNQMLGEDLANVNNIKQELIEAEKNVEILTDNNQRLTNGLTELENKNNILTIQIETNNIDRENLCAHIKESNEHFEQLKKDFMGKVSLISAMESKVQQYKKQYDDLNIAMAQKLQELQNENETLKTRHEITLENENHLEIDRTLAESQEFAPCFEKPVRTSVGDTKKESNVKAITPPSLLTICCNKIVDTMDKDSNLTTPSNSDTEFQNTAKVEHCANCQAVSLNLRILQQENRSLIENLEQTETENKNLILEQENTRREVQLLLEQAQELQKKISCHKTNLYVLTATTDAENRSLKSQVLALKHYHRKLLNVCQGDIPVFKRQLRELFIMLKDDCNSENQNKNLKRYSLPEVLDNNTTTCSFKNESTLDDDLLMLDTNVTLTTTGDSTLVGCDHTCLDITQTTFNEASCQTNDLNNTESNINCNISLLESDSQNMFSSMKILKDENCKLKDLVSKLSVIKGSECKVDAQSSPIKVNTANDEEFCTKCRNESYISAKKEDEVKLLSQQLHTVQREKLGIEEKYNSLLLEMPNREALVSKFKALESECSLKCNEVTKLTNTLNSKNKELKTLVDENESLSNQIMENIMEADNLNKAINEIKKENIHLTEKLQSVSQAITLKCPQCGSSKIEATRSVPITDNAHAKLNRSLSDSETSSRFNKICTLQSELCAGREDCKDLTEHVATIKQHLNCSNVSMDLDESIGDSHVQTKNVTQNIQHTCNMPNIQEEQPVDVYKADKMDCYNYYLEITGDEHQNLSNDVKAVDILQLFYNSLLESHANEIENLSDKLKEYEETKTTLETQINDLQTKYSTVSNSLEEKENNLNKVSKFMKQVNCNVNRICTEVIHENCEDLEKIIQKFRQNLKLLDYEFCMSSTDVFEAIVDKFQGELKLIKEQLTASEHDKSNADIKNLQELTRKLDEKESQYNILKCKNERMFEINSAVTMELVKKQQDIQKSVFEGCQKLLKYKIISSDLVMTESVVDNINIIIDNVINHYQQQLQSENEMFSLEINQSKAIIESKEKELIELRSQIQSLRDVNNNVTTDLADKEEKFHTLKSEYEDLNKAYNSKIAENIKKLNEIDNLTEEITTLKERLNKNESFASALVEKDSKISELLNSIEELHQKLETLNVEISNLKETINKKELLITSLSEKNAQTTELIQSINELHQDNERLLNINEMISKERESYSHDLEKSSETIKQNNAEIEKMTSDILVLRESVKDATFIIESLKEEVQKMTVINSELKLSLDEKQQECSRLEMNSKIHDKTAELQSKIIIRLKKQIEENDTVIQETQTKLNEVNEKYNALENECEKLKNANELLETRVNELREVADRRSSVEPTHDSTRRRRQSLHDSKRLLQDLEEQRNAEAVFGCGQKVDDLFADDVSSGRSTPFGLARGRDSLLSRTDQSDKDEDRSSRASSAVAARRRRQSIHDLHRGVSRHTPSPHDHSSRVADEHHSRDTSANKSETGEISVLRAELSSCRQELEELKERYRELDEECETCAEYLRERDERCVSLRREKDALEKQILEMKSRNSNSVEKPSVAHVAVNTDEDWTNLHAIVVDRMSYDAEVEKNKKLTKIIQELRCQKQDLKNTLTKMQKALEKQHPYKDNRELEATRRELKSVKEELEQLKIKYKELDEECETCAEYLKEREEQCRRLKEAKAALESKLQELQEEAHALAHYSVRKKRQCAHDLHRTPALDHTDDSTRHNEDSQSDGVERDVSIQKGHDAELREIKRLKMAVEKLSHEKAAMEQQLQTQAPLYVATGSGIVQNQQLTDVMKENQRLKKMNAKLVNICKKRGKGDANRENEDPCEQG